MLTEKDYCDYDTCVALAELGITYCGLHFYVVGDKDILCHNILQHLTTKSAEVLNYVLAIPLYIAQKWLREEKGIEVVVLSVRMIGAPYYFQVYTEDYVATDDNNYDTFEKALSEGIKEAVKILKDK